MTRRFDADFLIIGAGLVGLATAWKLLCARPNARALVLDKEHAVATHQSGRNSGVIHAGVYYEPGSLKARFCREGLQATYAFCAEHDIPHARCGKLIVATSPLEVLRLKALAERARTNAAAVEWLDQAALSETEPAVTGLAALRVDDTGMADYPAMARALATLVQNAGARIELGQTVQSVRERSEGVEVQTPGAAYSARHLIVCAGLQGDRLARQAGLALDFAIVPFRGDYFRLHDARSSLIRHHIYPVPDPALPFLGIHLTRLVEGGISVGPSAMLAFAREGYRLSHFNARDLRDMVLFPGLWRVLGRHAGAGLRELGCALSKSRYLREIRKYCPSVELEDLLPHPSGVRAQAVSRDGRLLHNFLIRETAHATFVCNAPSPAATASLPIGAEIARLALRH
ncbi:MAG: L-2-hydroxyglutarate oxidase [Gammaproteobacteria bacterium]|nr:L-2-hydroxyglutarate oxidase [Gammaproteobacteria bacterium]